MIFSDASIYYVNNFLIKVNKIVGALPTKGVTLRMVILTFQNYHSQSYLPKLPWGFDGWGIAADAKNSLTKMHTNPKLGKFLSISFVI